MRDPLGSRGGERKRGAASHGKADNRNLGEVERIDDTGEGAAEMSARVTAGVVRRIAKVADNRNLVEVERIDDTGEVAAEMSARVTAGVVRRIAKAVAALVIGDDRV